MLTTLAGKLIPDHTILGNCLEMAEILQHVTQGLQTLPQEFNASGKLQRGQDLLHSDHCRQKGKGMCVHVRCLCVKKPVPCGTTYEVKGY